MPSQLLGIAIAHYDRKKGPGNSRFVFTFPPLVMEMVPRHWRWRPERMDKGLWRFRLEDDAKKNSGAYRMYKKNDDWILEIPADNETALPRFGTTEGTGWFADSYLWARLSIEKISGYKRRIGARIPKVQQPELPQQPPQAEPEPLPEPELKPLPKHVALVPSRRPLFRTPEELQAYMEVILTMIRVVEKDTHYRVQRDPRDGTMFWDAPRVTLNPDDVEL